MVFRSANLMVTFVMGYLFFGKRYSLPQFVCVLGLTLGAASATFAEALVGDTAKAATAAAAVSGSSSSGVAAQRDCVNGVGPGCGLPPADLPVPSPVRQLIEQVVGNATALPDGAAAGAAPASYMFWWSIGVLILTAVLVLQSILANYQSRMAQRFGKAPQEAMFYMHTLSLPAFAATLGDLLTRAALWSQSPATGPLLLPALAQRVWFLPLRWLLQTCLAPFYFLPVMWTYAILNVFSQYVCIVGVYRLTASADPLTVNVTLTVRKFVSLLLSIYVFNNTFTIAHWIGAVLVFGAALWYTKLPQPPSAGEAVGPVKEAKGGDNGRSHQPPVASSSSVYQHQKYAGAERLHYASGTRGSDSYPSGSGASAHPSMAFSLRSIPDDVGVGVSSPVLERRSDESHGVVHHRHPHHQSHSAQEQRGFYSSAANAPPRDGHGKRS
jgi:hypothetical protein